MTGPIGTLPGCWATSCKPRPKASPSPSPRSLMCQRTSCRTRPPGLRALNRNAEVVMAKMPKVELEVSITTDNEVAADLLLDHGFERQAVHVRKADRLERMMDAM